MSVTLELPISPAHASSFPSPHPAANSALLRSRDLRCPPSHHGCCGHVTPAAASAAAWAAGRFTLAKVSMI